MVAGTRRVPSAGQQHTECACYLSGSAPHLSLLDGSHGDWACCKWFKDNELPRRLVVAFMLRLWARWCKTSRERFGIGRLLVVFGVRRFIETIRLDSSWLNRHPDSTVILRAAKDLVLFGHNLSLIYMRPSYSRWADRFQGNFLGQLNCPLVPQEIRNAPRRGVSGCLPTEAGFSMALRGQKSTYCDLRTIVAQIH